MMFTIMKLQMCEICNLILIGLIEDNIELVKSCLVRCEIGIKYENLFNEIKL